MKVVIETERLQIRTFTINDARLIYDLNNDPEVSWFKHDPISDPDHAKYALEKTILPQYGLYNYGHRQYI